MMMTYTKNSQHEARREDRPERILRQQWGNSRHDSTQQKGNPDNVSTTPALGHNAAKKRSHQVAPEEAAEDVRLILLAPRIPRAVLEMKNFHQLRSSRFCHSNLTSGRELLVPLLVSLTIAIKLIEMFVRSM